MQLREVNTELMLLVFGLVSSCQFKLCTVLYFLKSDEAEKGLFLKILLLFPLKVILAE